jgi:hypothetical protein
MNMLHEDILSFLDAKYISLQKFVIIPARISDRLNEIIHVRNVNYNEKFTMQYPEINYEKDLTYAELLTLIQRSDCNIITDLEYNKEFIEEINTKHNYIVEDDINDICEHIKKITQNILNNEPFGIDISQLRKAGSLCKANIKSGGPVSFGFIYDVISNAVIKRHNTNAISWLYVFSACSNIITQNNRNGANIGLLHYYIKYMK